MKTAITSALKQRIINHEGLRLKPYRCSANKLTIGVGRNLDDVGLSETEAYYLLDNDLKACENVCQYTFPWFEKLNILRQGIIIEMVFNLGIIGFLGFKKMIKALSIQDFAGASQEMIDSRWAKQVGQRANRLSLMMKTGKEVNTQC